MPIHKFMYKGKQVVTWDIVEVNEDSGLLDYFIGYMYDGVKYKSVRVEYLTMPLNELEALVKADYEVKLIQAAKVLTGPERGLSGLVTIFLLFVCAGLAYSFTGLMDAAPWEKSIAGCAITYVLYKIINTVRKPKK